MNEILADRAVDEDLDLQVVRSKRLRHSRITRYGLLEEVTAVEQDIPVGQFLEVLGEIIQPQGRPGLRFDDAHRVAQPSVRSSREARSPEFNSSPMTSLINSLNSVSVKDSSADRISRS